MSLVCVCIHKVRKIFLVYRISLYFYGKRFMAYQVINMGEEMSCMSKLLFSNKEVIKEYFHNYCALGYSDILALSMRATSSSPLCVKLFFKTETELTVLYTAHFLGDKGWSTHWRTHCESHRP